MAQFSMLWQSSQTGGFSGAKSKSVCQSRFVRANLEECFITRNWVPSQLALCALSSKQAFIQQKQQRNICHDCYDSRQIVPWHFVQLERTSDASSWKMQASKGDLMHCLHQLICRINIHKSTESIYILSVVSCSPNKWLFILIIKQF